MFFACTTRVGQPLPKMTDTQKSTLHKPSINARTAPPKDRALFEVSSCFSVRIPLNPLEESGTKTLGT